MTGAIVIELPCAGIPAEADGHADAANRMSGPIGVPSALERTSLDLSLVDAALTVEQGLSIGLHVAVFRSGEQEIHRFGWCEDEAVDRLRDDLDARIGTRRPATSR